MEFIAMEFIAGNKEEFIPIATGNRKNYINIFIKILVGSKPNKHGSVVFRRRNISRGNTKYPIMYGYSEGFYIRLELVPPAVLLLFWVVQMPISLL
jgi:hypothetical protein